VSIVVGAFVVGCGGSDGGDASGADSGVPVDSSPTGGGGGADAPKTDAPGGATGGSTGGAFVPDWAEGTATKGVYVSPTGDDGNDGSRDHPYKTTGKAWGSRGPGVRIDFPTGSFDCPPFTSDLLATTSAPFVVRAVDGPRTAKFDCGGTADFYFSHAKAIVL